jgi:CelD/BcsL family acetyltransferase involved in cellulose biosynthesis
MMSGFEGAHLAGYRVSSFIVENSDEIRSEWLDLQTRSDASWFQSWGWIGTWLKQVAGDLHPMVVMVRLDGRPVGLGLLVERDIRRRGVFHSNALFLNEYPFNDRNMVIEYNGLLAERGFEDDVYRVIIDHLLQAGSAYDEFHFGAITDKAAGSLEKAALGKLKFGIDEESLAWQADLCGLEAGIDNYLATLSSNARLQIRRALRLYEQQGPIHVQEAQDVRQALVFFDGLKELHTAQWQARGRRGAFANPRWEQFHRALIQARFDKGEVQLLKVADARGELGYIYSHLWCKRVYMQQTGFSVPADNRLKPGYVAHALAIQHNIKNGMHLYDFMHGDARYKRTLSNRSERLCWAVIQRRRMKFRLENLLVGTVRRCRRLSA